MLRIAIADDHTIVRFAVRQVLEASGQVEIVGEARNGNEAVSLVKNVQPDVLLLDLNMPEKDGLEALGEITALGTPTKVLVLTMHDEPSYGVRAMQSGAHGVMHKTSDPEVLLQAIRSVMRGEPLMPDSVKSQLGKRDIHPASILSAREREVMEYLARGYTNREIAAKLEISIKTVDTHRGHVLKKLNLRNNSDLTRFAIQHGYVAVTKAS
jgi:DNA-binding NarL/FixJ family response regulator